MILETPTTAFHYMDSVEYKKYLKEAIHLLETILEQCSSDIAIGLDLAERLIEFSKLVCELKLHIIFVRRREEKRLLHFHSYFYLRHVLHLNLIALSFVSKLASSGISKLLKTTKPPSTTMPWTIWPALVVLWGVCWMFYTPLNSANKEQFEVSLLEINAAWDAFSGPSM